MMRTKPQNRGTTWTIDEWQQPAGPAGGDFVITRWRNDKGQFGMERVLDVIEQSDNDSPALRLGRRIASFSDRAVQQHDVTILTLRTEAA